MTQPPVLHTLPDEDLAVFQLAEKTRHTYRADFFRFCQEICGYPNLLDPHREMCALLQYGQAKPCLFLMPRYSYKSSIGTVAFTLWSLLKNPNERILIYSDTTEKAQGFLSLIKHHIEGRTPDQAFRKLTSDVPWEVDPQQGTWNQSAITISVRDHAQKEPSVDTAGIETSKVGMHYDTIIFDDIVSDKNTTTKDQMEKVYTCYTKSLSLLKPGGRVIMIGTRWHFWDLYGRLLTEAAQTDSWHVYLRQACEDGVYPYAVNGLDEKFVNRQRAIQGTRLWSCLYQNQPTDDETATFKYADFRFYHPAHTQAFRQWVKTLYITAVLDAIPPPKNDRGDDAAITVVGTDDQNCLYLLDAVSGRMTIDQQITEVLSLHQKWTFQRFGMETNAFQTMVKSALQQRLNEARKTPGFIPFSLKEFTGNSQGTKERRIQGLQPYHETGALKFPGQSLDTISGVYKDLAMQMTQFPHAAKDDLLDSLAYHLQLSQTGSGSPTAPEEYPYTSAAWFEREQRKQALRVMRRRPRWERQPIPELVFS